MIFYNAIFYNKGKHLVSCFDEALFPDGGYGKSQMQLKTVAKIIGISKMRRYYRSGNFTNTKALRAKENLFMISFLINKKPTRKLFSEMLLDFE